MTEQICRRCRTPAASAAARYCEECGQLLDGAAPATIAKPAATWTEAVIDASLAVASDTGRRHRINQDRGLAMRRQDGLVLVAVADGVSSSHTPERAAEAAMAAVDAGFERATGAPEEIASSLVEAAANAVLALPPGEVPGRDPPETTIVVVVVDRAALGVAWVGDSRAYVLAEGCATRITRDDSWAEDAIAKGMARDTAMSMPEAHAITQCLGMPLDEIAINVATRQLTPSCGVLVCTDGLWNYFDSDPAIAGAYAGAAAGTDAAMACRTLVAKANACGGQDNITVAILKA